VGKQIVFCTFFVGLQGVVKNKLKVMGRGASMVSLRHESECVRAVRVGKKMVNFWVSTVYRGKEPTVGRLPTLGLRMADKRARHTRSIHSARQGYILARS